MVDALLSLIRWTVPQHHRASPARAGSGGEKMVNVYGLQEPVIDVKREYIYSEKLVK
jgi:hypothetical protein